MKAPAPARGRALLAAIALAALSAAPAEAQAGITAVPEGRQGDYDVSLVRDGTGRDVTLLAQGPVSEAQRQALLALRDRVLGFRALKVRSARVLVTPAGIDVLLVPDTYVFDGQDLLPFVPAGIVLHQDAGLSYDFRMLVGHYLLRMRGPFESEDALSRRLVQAALAPGDFFSAETTQYLGDRFAAIEGRIASDETRGTAALQALQTQVSDLEKRGASILQAAEAQGSAALKDLAQARAEIAVLQNDTAALQSEAATLRTDQGAARSVLDATKTELESVRASLMALPTERIQADVQALQKSLGSLGTDVETLRTAIVVMQSRGGNFGRRGINRDAITRLVTFKRTNPALTQDEASKMLKAQGLSMSNKDIGLVFGVFFSDYK